MDKNKQKYFNKGYNKGYNEGYNDAKNIYKMLESENDYLDDCF